MKTPTPITRILGCKRHEGGMLIHAAFDSPASPADFFLSPEMLDFMHTAIHGEPAHSFTVAGVLKSCEKAREMSLAKNETEIRELPAGTIVKIAGMPLQAVRPLSLETHPGNWEAIRDWQEGPHQGSQVTPAEP